MRRFLWFILCLLLAVAPATVVGQERSLTAEQETRLVELVEGGKKAYDAGEFRQAREKFGQAYDLYPHPDILYRIALCHERLGEDQQAVAYYRRFLAEAPEAPERARVQKTIEVIEARIAKSEIRITSEPDGATVFIDDEANGAAGYTPTALGVKPGNYKLIVKKPGYETVRELVTVTAGNSVQVRYQLSPVREGEEDVVGAPREPDRPRTRGPSVKLVTLLVVGGAAGVTSAIFFQNYSARKDDLGAKPRSEFSRPEYEALQRKANINLALGISTGAISAFSLIWAYGLWLSESSATAWLPAPGWTDGPAVGWAFRF